MDACGPRRLSLGLLATLAACGGGGTGPTDDPSAVRSISILAPKTNLRVTEVVVFQANVTYMSSQNSEVVICHPTWTSSNPDVAPVADGSITALKEGTATITAACRGKSGTATVTVLPAPFPAAAGKYAISGTFDGISGATLTGSVTLNQYSRLNGDLYGDGTYRATISGVSHTLSGVYKATVSETGAITIEVGPGNGLPPSAGRPSLTFTGARSGASVVGRHTFSDGAATYRGPSTLTLQP